ncbi:MAG: LemA family protein [Planctomycetota bacterium]
MAECWQALHLCARFEHPFSRPALTIGVVAGVLLLVAWALLAFARRKDHENWIRQKAPLLPLALVNVRDDAWLRGETRSDTPLSVPHFGDTCLAYDYRLEEEVTESYTDSNGDRKTRKRWVTREHLTDTVEFELVQGELSIRIHAGEAELHDLPRLGPDREFLSSYRHSASFLPHPSVVSALGSVGEGRARLEQYQSIPLLVTPRTRERFLLSAERSEKALRIAGLVLALLGSAGLFYAGALRLELPSPAREVWSVPQALLAGGLGLLLFLLLWTLHTFNTMVLYRNRTRAAWKQIDVDLKNRHDLIPRLVEVIRGAADHERGLFQRLAELRGGLARADERRQIMAEGELSGEVRRLIAVREEYPELSSNQVFLKLHRELTALEEKIAHARGFFNDCANEYNTFVSQMPRALLARPCGFSEWPLFQVQAGESGVPDMRGAE